MKIKIKNVAIGPILEGSLSDIKDSVLVNELDSNLTFEGSIAGEIVSICGRDIKEESKRIFKKLPVSVGSVFIAGNPIIIHAVVCEQRKKSDYLELCDAVRNSILLAETNQINSIVFPSIGSGVGQLSLKEAIFTIMEHIECVVYNASFEYLRNITFCARSSEEKQIFDIYWNEVFGKIL